jgi:hypothetical protein
MTLEIDRIYCGDCLDLMREIPDKSVDLVLTDPPYGTTGNEWDVPVPFGPMWEQFTRLVVNDRSPIVMFGMPPFSSELIVSNKRMYRYSWVWDKIAPVGHLNAKLAPLRRYEMIMVFSRKAPAYYPQMQRGKPYVRRRQGFSKSNYGAYGPSDTKNLGTRYPTDIIDQFHNASRSGRIHPTEKPVSLLEYLICTYSRPRDVVLDPFIGSGATAIACIHTGRHFIGIEKHEPYFLKAQERIDKERQQARLFSCFDFEEATL